MKSTFIAAAGLVAMGSAAGIETVKDLIDDVSAWGKDRTFYETLFQYLGNDPTGGDSPCKLAFNDFADRLPQYWNAMSDFAEYQMAAQAKGGAQGTDAGFYLNNFILYNEAQVMAFGLYNDCDLDYFMMAFGSSTQSVSGFANSAVNFAWRTVGGKNAAEYDALAAAITGGDMVGMGQNAAILAKDFFAVAIPDARISDTGDAYQVNQDTSV